jgi:microcystin-dependent protein
MGAALAALFLFVSPSFAATLLPNGMQYFTDQNGLPLSAGCVFFYVPGTLSPKATYQNSSQTIANTNPVQLDSAGRALVYGTGTFRQIVTAVGSGGTCSPAGAQIWDQLTADTASSVTIYAGASAGTPNAITVTAPAFSGTDGQVINYISTNTNTAAATINPSSFGAVAIVRDSATGPGALTGGELVATNAVSLIYDATAGTFHILSPVTWPNTSGVPVGTIIEVAGFTAPTNYAFAYGQAVSRTTYSGLFSALTSAQSGIISSGSPTITGLSDITQLGAGQPVESVGIPTSTTIVSCTGTSCTMSANATASRTGTMTFFAYADGDGSTTFNLPDFRDVALFGRGNMGGSDRGLLTSTYFGASPTVLGIVGGSQSQTLTLAQLPTGITTSGVNAITVYASGNSGLFVPTATGTWSGAATNSGGLFGPYSLNGNTVSGANSFSANNTINATSNNTSGNAHPIIPPAAIVNRAIRLVP